MSLKSRKSLSQHFLRDPEVAKYLASMVSERPVIEIGCGDGYLSRYLNPDLCVELDERFLQYLVEFNPVLADARKPPYMRGEVFSSLPYSISKIFLRESSTSSVRRMILILQSDFVEKLLHEPTYISFMVNYHFILNKLFHIPPSSFLPKPKVFSTAVEFKRVREYDPAVEKALACLSIYRNKDLKRASTLCGLGEVNEPRKIRSFAPWEVCELLNLVGYGCA